MTLAEQWRAEGRLEQAARSLLLVLDARGLSVSPALHERINATSDPNTLHNWVNRAVTASRIEDVLADPQPPLA